MFEISLNVNQSNQRLDKVLKKVLREAPPSFIYKQLRKKNITLNRQKALGNEITVYGDTVQFYLSQETYDKMRGLGSAAGALRVDSLDVTFPEIPILYEDSDVCIFVKPAGILSQKAVDTDFSINEWVIWHAKEIGLISDSVFETFKPSVCNRLDRNTGGIMAAGLSMKGLQVLSELFRERDLEKYYYAMVRGRLTEKKLVTAWLLKDEQLNRVKIYQDEVPGSRLIRTEYEPVALYEDRTLLRVHLLTGRSHQIRAHLSAIGYPIIGDPKYGDPAVNMDYGLFRQCLYAYYLRFPECELPGISGKTFQTEVPADWPLGPAEV